jgi:hypothetical protein
MVPITLINMETTVKRVKPAYQQVIVEDTVSKQLGDGYNYCQTRTYEIYSNVPLVSIDLNGMISADAITDA